MVWVSPKESSWWGCTFQQKAFFSDARFSNPNMILLFVSISFLEPLQASWGCMVWFRNQSAAICSLGQQDKCSNEGRNLFRTVLSVVCACLLCLCVSGKMMLKAHIWIHIYSTIVTYIFLHIVCTYDKRDPKQA